MAARPIWRGHLRLALVSCPIALHSVERSSRGLHFHLINPETGHRVRMITLDAETDQEVSRRNLVKGYEFEKDRYVLMDDEDFENARIESSSTLTVAKFVDRDSIEPIYFDTSYYVVPDGDAGQDVFVVLRDAIAKTGRAALSRVVIGRRERAVAIMPMGKGLVCHTLHQPSDLYDSKSLFEPIDDVKPDDDMVALATQLIQRQDGAFEPDDTVDRYEARLREVIDAKLRGEGIAPEAEAEPERGNVIDLMAALKASLGRVPETKKTDGKSAQAPDEAEQDVVKEPKPAKKTASRKAAAKPAAAKPAAAKPRTSSPARKRA